MYNYNFDVQCELFSVWFKMQSILSSHHKGEEKKGFLLQEALTNAAVLVRKYYKYFLQKNINFDLCEWRTNNVAVNQRLFFEGFTTTTVDQNAEKTIIKK